MVLSGTCLALQPLPYVAHEANYEKAIAALGLSDLTPEERIKTLLEIPGEELVAKLPPSVMHAVAVDGDLVLPGANFHELAKPESDFLAGKEWCQDLLIGGLEFDVRWYQHLPLVPGWYPLTLYTVQYPIIHRPTAEGTYYEEVHRGNPQSPSLVSRRGSTHSRSLRYQQRHSR